MSLREYQRKRDFSRTAEPKPEKAHSRSGAIFVIQKHDATRLHYDFRLELDGTLKSWAVPKGVPFTKGEKRLAAHVEDHPLDYASFEGIIPKGQYGGGTVMVWDTGTWEPLGGDPAKDLREGKLHFALHGKKLEGEWTLVRMRGEDEKNWLLIKSGDSMTPLSPKRDDESVVSGRTLAQIANDRDAEWQSNRDETPRKESLRDRIRRRATEVAKTARSATAVRDAVKVRKTTGAARPGKASVPNSQPRSKGRCAGSTARFVEPMKAKLVTEPPTGRDWVYELKFDGFRAVAVKNGAEVELISRNGNSLAAKFPSLTEAMAETIPAKSAVLDGEIVALDEQGRSSFQLLQALELGEERPPLCFYVFDLLHADDVDLHDLPLHERKAKLAALLHGVGDPIRYSADLVGDPRKLLAEVKERGLEGVIGKQRDSTYESGRRSGAWIKLKCASEQEFVIGGYTPPQGTRPHFGALLVGFYEAGKLKFAGKVGTGFNAKLLRLLYQQFQPLRRTDCPFSNLPEKQGGRWSQNITPAEMRRCTWIDPQLICQVRFTEWTRDGKLRHPVFVGMREDKAAKEVVRES